MKPNVGDRVVIWQKVHKGQSKTTWFDVEVVGTATYCNLNRLPEEGFAIQGKFPVGKTWYGKTIYEISWFSEHNTLAIVDKHEQIQQEIKNLEKMIGYDKDL